MNHKDIYFAQFALNAKNAAFKQKNNFANYLIYSSFFYWNSKPAAVSNHFQNSL